MTRIHTNIADQSPPILEGVHVLGIVILPIVEDQIGIIVDLGVDGRGRIQGIPNDLASALDLAQGNENIQKVSENQLLLTEGSLVMGRKGIILGKGGNLAADLVIENGNSETVEGIFPRTNFGLAILFMYVRKTNLE